MFLLHVGCSGRVLTTSIDASFSTQRTRFQSKVNVCGLIVAHSSGPTLKTYFSGSLASICSPPTRRRYLPGMQLTRMRRDFVANDELFTAHAENTRSVRPTRNTFSSLCVGVEMSVATTDRNPLFTVSHHAPHRVRHAHPLRGSYPALPYAHYRAGSRETTGLAKVFVNGMVRTSVTPIFLSPFNEVVR